MRRRNRGPVRTAPVLLVALRLLQGLALGGEYGGAATYVAEHAPNSSRGSATSWIQTTATLGFFLSLLVIGTCRVLLAPEVFSRWGWRLPFLVSLALLAFSIYSKAWSCLSNGFPSRIARRYPRRRSKTVIAVIVKRP